MEKLVKVNNLYAFISQVNQNIVRVKDEASLLRNSCRFAIEFGKFKMAWVGWFDFEKRNISLVEQSGIPDKDLVFFLNAPWQPKGPQDYVLSTGKYFICNDILNNLELLSWKPFCLERGINSCIVLPIKKCGLIKGTFNLYSTELNFSDEEKIALLVEAINDISFALDLFEKAKLQQEVAEIEIQNEKKFRNTLDNMLEGIQIHDFAFRYLYVNDVMVKSGPHSREELLGYTLMEKYPGIEETPLFKSLQRCMNERVSEHLETTFVFPDGTKTDFEISIEPIPEGISILSIDRTEQNKAKEKLLKVNRLYAFISAINQSIVHINNEQELLDNACKIAVEIGQFKMAWIDLIDVPSGKLNMVSVCGTKEIICAAQKVSGVHYKDPVLKGTPTGGVLSTGQLCVSNQLQNDSSMNPWKQELMENGIKAGISLPIKKFGKLVGVFGLYSAIESFFDDEEIELLKEATDDVSFAIGNFEKAKKHRLTEELVEKNKKQRAFDRNNLDALINNTKDLMWSVDRDFNLITSNKPFDEVSEISFGKIIEKGSSVLSVSFSFEMLNHFKKLYERAFDGETFTQTDYFDKPVEIWSEISYSPIRKDNVVVGAACHSRDITNRKITEKKLEESEARLKEAQAISHTGNWELDFAHHTHIWSDELYRIFGFNKGEVIPSTESFLAFVHPDDLVSIKEKVYEAFKTLKASAYNFRFIRKDGEVRYGYSERKFEFDKNNKPVRLIGVVQDVTEIKLVEQYLRQSETFTRGVLNSLSSHIAVLDGSGNIVAVNDAWKTFAIENGETTLYRAGVGSNYFVVCENAVAAGDESAGVALTGLKEVLCSKSPVFNFEYPCHSPNEQRWFKMRATKFENAESMIVVEHQNVTEKKLTEIEREKMISNIVQHSKNLEQFTFIVSHNLRGPVANILGLSNLLKKDISEENRVRSQQYIFTATEQLDEILKDLNKILHVRAEIGESKESLSLNELVNTIKSGMHAVIEKEKVQIVTDFEAVDAIISIKSYMHSIFYNLIANSIKYRQRGKTPFIEIRTELNEGKIRISFKDNGTGIDLAAHGEKLFGLYQRFHLSTEGKGLGLFMVKTQVEALGGSIKIESRQGEGAEFIIELPLLDSPLT